MLKILDNHLKKQVTETSDYIEIFFLDNGIDNVYFTIEGEELFISSNISKLPIKKVSLLSINFLLRNHTIPSPYSIHENIFSLTYGDKVIINKKNKDIKFYNSFPYFEKNSKENTTMTNEKLITLLSNSLSEQLDFDKESMLMLSAGKDSSSIAIALSEMEQKHKTFALTINSGFDTDEGNIASDIAKKLGLKHEIVNVNKKDSIDEETLLNFYKDSSSVVTDFAQIPYLIALNKYKHKNDLQIIDGSGSDVYVGHLPNKNGVIKNKFPVIRNSILQNFVPNFTKSNLRKFNFINQYKSERFLEGLELDQIEINKILKTEPHLVDNFWKNLDSEFAKHDLIDHKNFIRGRFLDTYTYTGKIKLATSFFGFNYILPWCNEDLIQNYFNLAIHKKYSKTQLINKIPVRKLIEDRLGLDLDKIGKRAFLFDKEVFFFSHKKFIINQILNCKIWDKNIEKFIKFLERNNDYNNLIVLFNISAWFNNTKYLER